MAKLKNKKVLAALAATLTVALCAASTFAWVTTQQNKDNKIATNIQNGQVTLNENFDPEKAQVLTPDASVIKQVTVTNTGDSPVITRVSFQELLSTLINGQDMVGTATAATAFAPYASNGDPTQASPTVSAKVAAMATKDGLPIVDGPTATGANLVTTGVGAIAVSANPAPYWATGSGWVEMDSTKVVFDTVTAPDAVVTGQNTKGLHVMYKLGPSVPVAGTTPQQYSYSVSYYAYYDFGAKADDGSELCQMVNLGDLGSSLTTFADSTSDPAVITKVTFEGVGGYAATASTPATKGNVEFMWYNGVESKNDTFAGENPLKLTVGNTIPGTPNDGTFAAASHPAQTILNFTNITTGTFAGLTKATSPLDANLVLYFNTASLDQSPTAPVSAEAKWWYNPADGYFYWMQALQPSSSTEELLDSFQLAGTASGAYANMKYDLSVYMDAIQATKAALVDTTTPAPATIGVGNSWNLTGVLLSTLQTACPN